MRIFGYIPIIIGIPYIIFYHVYPNFSTCLSMVEISQWGPGPGGQASLLERFQPLATGQVPARSLGESPTFAENHPVL